MKAIDNPQLMPVPFALNGQRNAIPQGSQIGITKGAASLNDGFPPLTMTSPLQGGIPPFGKDMNGVLYLFAQTLRWVQAGGSFMYDAAFANDPAIGGYPQGAVLLNAALTGFWISSVDNNVTDPDATDGSAQGWLSMNPDWNATSGPGEILNKPDLGQYLTQVTAQGSNGVTVSGAGTPASPLDVTAQLDPATGNAMKVSAAGLAVAAGTAAGDVVQLNANGALPTVDGSQLVGLTPAQVGADPAGTADADMAAHLAAADPHAQYLDDARGDARYDALGAAQQANAISIQSVPAALDGAADGYLLQVSGPAGAEQIVAVPSSLASTPQNEQMLYLATTTEVIAGVTYYQLGSSAPSGAPTQVTNATTAASTENLIGAWVSQAASSEADIPAGTWTISPWYAADNNANELHVDISTLDTATGNVTPVAQTIYNPSVTALQLHSFTMSMPAVTIPAGQRLLVQLYCYAAAKGHTITIWFGGTGYGSSVEYPVALVHNALGGLQGGSGTARYHLSQQAAANAENLKPVAMSGSYTDLTGTPSIPAAQVNSDWSATSGVAAVLNKPKSVIVNVTAGSAVALDLTPIVQGNPEILFNLTIPASGTPTLTFINPPGAGVLAEFMLVVINNTNSALAWPSGLRWPQGIVPSLTGVAGKLDTFVFYTQDGGATYYGFVAGQNQ